MAMPAMRYAAQENNRYEQRQLDFSAIEKTETESRLPKSHLQLAVNNSDLTQVNLPVLRPLSNRKTSALSGQYRQGLIHQYQQNHHSPQRKKQPKKMRSIQKRLPSPRNYMSEHPWVSDLGVAALMLMPYILIAQR